MANAVNPNLQVEGLTVSVHGDEPESRLINDISFTVGRNETVGLLGPSGSGKTTVALAILGLPPGGGSSSISGSIRLAGRELTPLTEPEYRSIRGPEIGMVFQDPTGTLIPTYRVSRLIADTLLAHQKLSRSQVTEKVRSLLAEVGFDDPDRIARSFPQQLSGGMSQRVAIALALANEPNLLIADEPTSSLDVIATDEVLTSIEAIRDRRDISILFISHEPTVVDRMTHRTIEIDHGRIVSPSNATPQTVQSVEAPPPPADPDRTGSRTAFTSQPASRSPTDFALELRNVSAAYSGASGQRQAATDVTLVIRPGETLGLVGANGAGKTTVARAALRLLEPQSGQILWGGVYTTTLSQDKLRPLRSQISAVLQHPAASLNPRQQVARIVATPLIAQGVGDRSQREKLVREALALVELPTSLASRMPRELSGGQQQRVALARAIVNRPRVLICDEPFTALDHPLREQLTDLLIRLQSDLGLACLFIDHDFNLVTHISDWIAVMQDGRIVETEATGEILTRPTESSTRRMVSLSAEPYDRPSPLNRTPLHPDNEYRHQG